MSQTGEHPSAPEKQPSTLAELVTALPRKIFTREAVLWVLTLVLGGVAAAQGIDRLDGGVDKRIEPVVAEQKRQAADIATTKAALERLSTKMDAAEERNARRFEVLYNATLERRAQPGAEELKQPADGGR